MTLEELNEFVDRYTLDNWWYAVGYKRGRLGRERLSLEGIKEPHAIAYRQGIIDGVSDRHLKETP